jgi:hypothetical protein
MAGYIRQDTPNNIANGSVVDADDLDAEFNAIEAAFNASTGHVHDGSSANGAAITKLGPSQNVVATSSTFEPKTDNTIDLGTSSKEFKDLYLQGDAKVGSITLGGTAITATAASINALSGVNATSAEINHLVGVTSPIQTQLGNKQPLNSALTSISGLSTSADKMIYTTGSNSYAVTGLTSVARNLLDDATVADQRTTLGLTIGTNVQAWDADLDAIAALSKADGTFIVGNGSTWVAETGNTAIASLGISATGTELSYVSGATSNLQTQITNIKASPFSVTGNALAGAELRLPEITTNGSNYVALKAPANLASNVTLTLPTTDGNTGDLLQTDGSGNLSFISAGSLGGGTVTSVAVSGGTTGLTTSGGPITGSGTITIAGTLAVANGGTGATSAASALTNLGAQATITGGASSITSSNLTASRALVADASGKVAVSSVTATELSYLSSVSSSVQNQLNAKQPLDSTLTSLAALSSSGMLAQTGTDTFAARTITAGTGISISNGNGVSGNPTISATNNGTVTSITAGTGLTGGTITSSGTIAIDSSYAPAKLSTASGSAASYSARAWVNFNGSGTPSISASGNVSSITDIAVGRFGVNFSTAMPDANYATTGGGRRGDGANDCNFSLNTNSATYSTTRVDISFADGSSGNLLDPVIGCVAVFR